MSMSLQEPFCCETASGEAHACLLMQVLSECGAAVTKPKLAEDMATGRLPCMPICTEIEFLRAYMGSKALAGKEVIPDEGTYGILN